MVVEYISIDASHFSHVDVDNRPAVVEECGSESQLEE